jgi:hypothetical protein
MAAVVAGGGVVMGLMAFMQRKVCVCSMFLLCAPRAVALMQTDRIASAKIRAWRRL